ncbi:MAG: hypothetical protein E7231_16290 [Cellulosilyticum sp.]|nr:hypothetical protein [Cellulosilyticum sp.]
MKKLGVILLSLGLVLGLTACGGSGEVQEPTNVTTGESTQNEEVSTEVTVTPNVENTNKEATIEETVILDESGIKVTAKGISYDSIMGPSVQLLIENNSGKDLTFQCRDTSINGNMVEPMFSVDVVNGKKANDTITFMDSDLEKYGIETIADITFSLNIMDSSSWEDYIVTPQIQLKTSAFDTYEYTYDNSGQVVYNENGIEVVVKGLATDSSLLGPGIVVYIANNSNQDITVQARDISVNGFMIDGIFSQDVVVGKHALSEVTFLESDLEQNGITNIENAELAFHIFDKESWDTIVDTDVVKITF